MFKESLQTSYGLPEKQTKVYCCQGTCINKDYTICPEISRYHRTATFSKKLFFFFFKGEKKKLFTEVLYNQFQPDLSLVSVLVAKSSSYVSTRFVWREQCNKDAVCPCLQHSGNE